MANTESDEPENLEKSDSPFRKHKEDSLLKLKIGDFFRSDDPLAVDVVRLMTVDEDLANIERFKAILEADRPTAETDEISQAKWNRGQFLLVRIRLGFLSNAWKDIFVQEEKGRPSLKELLANRSSKVQEAYRDVCDAVAAAPRAKKVIHDFRNQASFHYGYTQFRKGLELTADDMGEIVVNPNEKDIQFILAYQVIDTIPAGRPGKVVIEQLNKEIEMIQGKLHAFIVTLADEFVFSNVEEV